MTGRLLNSLSRASGVGTPGCGSNSVTESLPHSDRVSSAGRAPHCSRLHRPRWRCRFGHSLIHFCPPADGLDPIAGRFAPAEQFPRDAEFVRFGLRLAELGPQPVQLVRGDVAGERKVRVRSGLPAGEFLPFPLPRLPRSTLQTSHPGRVRRARRPGPRVRAGPPADSELCHAGRMFTLGTLSIIDPISGTNSGGTNLVRRAIQFKVLFRFRVNDLCGYHHESPIRGEASEMRGGNFRPGGGRCSHPGSQHHRFCHSASGRGLRLPSRRVQQARLRSPSSFSDQPDLAGEYFDRLMLTHAIDHREVQPSKGKNVVRHVAEAENILAGA